MLQTARFKPVSDYLQETIGIDAAAEAVKEQELKKLPLFLRSGYIYYRVHLLGKEIIFATLNSSDLPTPDQLKKQESQLQRVFSTYIVFVLEQLEAYQRKRFVQKQIPFLVPGKQLYMPFLFIDLQERFDKPTKEVSKLRPSSQCLLLYHLEVAPLDGIPFKEIARKLHYTNMTISRAAKELAVVGLAEVKGTREKQLSLLGDRKALWQKSRHLMQSPVKERVFISQLPPAVSLYMANETALAAYSDLAAGKVQEFAIGEEAYRQLKEAGKLQDLNKTDGAYALEVWAYDPGLLAANDRVDPLSLYLSLAEDTEDERVLMALEQMMEHVTW
jgi:DNA-binding MarR family transcriptional regulator